MADSKGLFYNPQIPGLATVIKQDYSPLVRERQRQKQLDQQRALQEQKMRQGQLKENQKRIEQLEKFNLKDYRVQQQQSLRNKIQDTVKFHQDSIFANGTGELTPEQEFQLSERKRAIQAEADKYSAINNVLTDLQEQVKNNEYFSKDAFSEFAQQVVTD